jgi:hypothetical protein
VQSGHKGVYWSEQERHYVQWVLPLLVLPCTGVLVVGGYKLSRDGADPRSLRGRCVCGFLFSKGVCFDQSS